MDEEDASSGASVQLIETPTGTSKKPRLANYGSTSKNWTSDCFEVGDLVQDRDGHSGIVKYIGPVARASKKRVDLWVGVRWDEAGRGSNDGAVTDSTHGRIRYFECEKGYEDIFWRGSVHAP